MVALLAKGPRSAGTLGSAFELSAPATSRHLKVLREAGLVEDQRSSHDNRVRVYRLREEPLVDLKAWLEQLERDWGAQLLAFKRHVEARAGRSKVSDLPGPKRRRSDA